MYCIQKILGLGLILNMEKTMTAKVITVQPVFKDNSIGHKNVVSQNR